MATIKEYNVKIKSLKNTQKITKTMKMVSASKLRRAQEAQVNAKLYAHNLSELILRVALSVDDSTHPLLSAHVENKKALILVITSDKGLCGAFNNNCFKKVLAWKAQNSQRYDQIDLSFCGRRGYAFFRKIMNVRNYYENVTGKPEFSTAKQIGQDLSDGFLNYEYDEIFLVYNQFLSPISQKTIFEKVLPARPDEIIAQQSGTPAVANDYLFEPEKEQLLEFLIPHFLYFKIYFALLENSAGEHGARMSAMENASKNASELIDKNTLLRNRVRQAAITTELTEIVAGAEAL